MPIAPSTACLVRVSDASTGAPADVSNAAFSIVLPPAPVVTGLTPGSGAIGSAVTVTGTGFTGMSEVTFHGVVAPYTSVSDTQFTTTVPSGHDDGAGASDNARRDGHERDELRRDEPAGRPGVPPCYVPGYELTVSIALEPAPGVFVQAAADTRPTGWSVGTVNEAGEWDAPTSQVKWGLFFDGTARVLTYHD